MTHCLILQVVVSDWQEMIKVSKDAQDIAELNASGLMKIESKVEELYGNKAMAAEISIYDSGVTELCHTWRSIKIRRACLSIPHNLQEIRGSVSPGLEPVRHTISVGQGFEKTSDVYHTTRIRHMNSRLVT